MTLTHFIIIKIQVLIQNRIQLFTFFFFFNSHFISRDRQATVNAKLKSKIIFFHFKIHIPSTETVQRQSVQRKTPKNIFIPCFLCQNTQKTVISEQRRRCSLQIHSKFSIFSFFTRKNCNLRRNRMWAICPIQIHSKTLFSVFFIPQKHKFEALKFLQFHF